MSKKQIEEYWVLKETEYLRGPFASVEEAKESLEDWEFKGTDIRIARTVLVAETVVTHTTTWNSL